MKYYFSPSLMCGQLLALKEEISLLEKYDFDWLHLDVMDLNFVPNLTLGFDLINQIKSKMSKDIHLMVKNVALAVERLQTKPTDYLTFHLEAAEHIESLIRKIKKKARVGLALKPKTALKSVYPYLKYLDLVLVMSVEPGFAGQKFMPETYERVTSLAAEIKKNKQSVIIGVDGGVSPEKIKKLCQLGASMFVLGTSTLYNKGDFEENLRKFTAFRKIL